MDVSSIRTITGSGDHAASTASVGERLVELDFHRADASQFD